MDILCSQTFQLVTSHLPPPAGDRELVQTEAGVLLWAGAGVRRLFTWGRACLGKEPRPPPLHPMENSESVTLKQVQSREKKAWQEDLPFLSAWIHHWLLKSQTRRFTRCWCYAADRAVPWSRGRDIHERCWKFGSAMVITIKQDKVEVESISSRIMEIRECVVFLGPKLALLTETLNRRLEAVFQTSHCFFWTLIWGSFNQTISLEKLPNSYLFLNIQNSNFLQKFHLVQACGLV